MRQRITYLQNPEDSLDPGTLEIGTAHIKAKEVKAAREEKITFGLDELPKELHEVLKRSYEVHVRWVSERPFESRAPAVSRLSPGLHVFYTPQMGGSKQDLLCPMLKKVFGDVDCVSPEQSFTSLPTERFSHSAALQYYTPLPSLVDLTAYLMHKLCPSRQSTTSAAEIHASCLSRVHALSSASSLDINYDTISHALVLSAYFRPATQSIALTNHSPSNSRLEVGILSVEKTKQPEELQLGGFLTVVGEDSKASPTLFSFPARHHPTSNTFTSKFIHPTGLHPTLELAISASTPPMDDRSCKLHAHLSLPRSIFVDRYQLTDPLFLASKNLSALHYITSPVDLEAPSCAVELWGSSVLLELAPPSPPANLDQEWKAHIPLHLRYMPPSADEQGLTELEVPSPVLFWACTADEGSKFSVNPFDRVNLGYDGLFGPRTLFFHLTPEASSGGDGRLVSQLTVPVLDLDRSGYVEMGTLVGVTLGFGWVMWCLWDVWRRGGGWKSYPLKETVLGEKKRE